MEPLDRTAVLGDLGLVGRSFCEAHSDTVDAWLAMLFATLEVPTGAALVAVGGYGRRELCPQSDLDLLLLHDDRVDVNGLAESIWYPIWDTGMKLGHSVRTRSEALKLASEDLDTATSLLNARTIAGDDSLTQQLLTDAHRLWNKRSKQFLSELAQAVDSRHRTAGEVAFLLEPDLKSGRGGLRDVHSIGWVSAIEDCARIADAEALERSAEVLLKSRVALHRVTGRRGDTLTLQEQDDVAEQLGYPDADELMADVAAAARKIAWSSDETWWTIVSGLRRQNRLRRSSVKSVGHGLIVSDGLVRAGEDVDLSDPFLALRAALVAARGVVRIDATTLQAFADNFVELPDPWPPEARQLLVDILASGHPAIGVFEMLDHADLLTRFLPEWEPIRSRPQRNAYHRFTVDRHLLETAANASASRSATDRVDLLLIGALLHDIGKGYPGDHTEVGMSVVRGMATRLGFAAGDVDTLVSMVEHHLLLPDVATRRDISDPGTAQLVAEKVGSLELLGLLHALTEADSLATGPSAWGMWKADLVERLVSVTAHHLGGGDPGELVDPFPTAEHRQLLAAGRREVIGDGEVLTVVAPDRPGLFAKVAGALALNGIAVLEATAFSDDEGMALDVIRVRPELGTEIDWERLTADVHRALDGRLALAARIAQRSRLYSARPRVVLASNEPTIRVDNDVSASSTVIEVHARDSIGVLYRITHALSEMGIDIRSAKVQTLGNDVVDAFYVRDSAGNKVVDPDFLAEIELAVQHVLRDDRGNLPAQPVAGRQHGRDRRGPRDRSR